MIRVDSSRRPEALERLLAIDGVADPSHVNRFIDFAGTNQVALDAMWASCNSDGRLMHTVLAVPSPGRTAMFFASHPQRREEIGPIGTLIDVSAGEVAAMDVELAQALLDPAEVLEREAFLKGGFSELARLSYMERAVPRSRKGLDVQWPEHARVVAYDDSQESDLLRVLEASYDHTLDCPALRGLRDTRDILDGHRGTGAFDPTLWTLLRVQGEAVGALLMNSAPNQRSIEIVYIGLAPSVRGQGYGRRLLRYGLSLVAGRRERMLNLAVDERNEPALALYRAEQFRRALRRVALIRSLRSAAK